MKTLISAQKIANYFIVLASKTDENDLTNLKLQKLLYFAQGKYLAETGKPLFKEPVEAWRLGPVIRSVYDNFKYCGPYPITAFDKKVERPDLPKTIQSFLDTIWDRYSRFSASYLVNKTHESGSPWKETYRLAGDNKEIPIESMLRYFKTAES